MAKKTRIRDEPFSLAGNTHRLVFLKVHRNPAKLGVLVKVDQFERRITRRGLVFGISLISERNAAGEGVRSREPCTKSLGSLCQDEAEEW